MKIDLFRRMEIGPFAFSLFQLLLFCLAAVGLIVAWGAFEQMTACSRLISMSGCGRCFALKNIGVITPG